MALSLAEKLKQAAAARMAETAQDTNARLDGMDGKTGQPPAQVVSLESSTETPAPCGETSSEKDGQTRRSDQLVRPPGQANRSDRTVTPKTRLDLAVRPESSPERSDQTVDKVRPDGQTNWSDRTVRPEGQTVVLNKARPLAKTAQQRAVYGYLAANPDVLTSTNNLSEILTIAPTTLRKILDCLERGGAIRKTRIGNDGLRIQFANANRSDHPVRPIGQTERSDRTPSKKIDRENLSISLEAIRLTWPRLAAAGFGPEQLDQIHVNLAETGQSAERVLQGLSHAEWELEHDQMLDKDGQPVADPCSWVFRSLARTGYYRRPKGYVSPEEQALRDQEEEARGISQARQKADQARFEAWRDSLSQEERKIALRGKIGPDDAWLKKVWREKQNTPGQPLKNDGL